MSIGDKRLIQFFAIAGLSFALSVGPPSWSRADDFKLILEPSEKSDAKGPVVEVETDKAAAVTTKDPQIALDDLELLLAPMTKDELEVEAKGWLDLVRAKERDISAAELDVHRKNREIGQLEKQKAAAAELAKATQEVKAADSGGAGSEKDKAAAAERLVEAQKTLVKTVETAKKENAKEAEKAETATAAMAGAKDAVAASPSGAGETGSKAAPDAGDQAVQQKAAEAAQKKSEATGDETKVVKVAAATEKEASAAEEIKSLAQAAPVAAEKAVDATATAPAATSAAVSDTSKKAEKLEAKADEATAAKTDVKVQLIDYSTQLRSERTALTDRLKVVVDKFEARGGDPKPYRLFVASLGGVKIDVSDRAATWARITSWLTADEGGMRWARNLGTFLAYILGAVVVAWIVRKILRRVMTMKATEVSSHLLRDFIVTASGRVIVAVGVLMALSALEFNLAPLLAVIGAAGFVVAFALQGTLSNFASGLLIMVNKPFDVGDNVQVGGDIKGKVSGVTIFNTIIQTADGLKKIVPNNSIWNGTIINYTTHMVQNAGAHAQHEAEGHGEKEEGGDEPDEGRHDADNAETNQGDASADAVPA
jgi:small conductance mechanosensitive channel